MATQNHLTHISFMKFIQNHWALMGLLYTQKKTSDSDKSIGIFRRKKLNPSPSAFILSSQALGEQFLIPVMSNI